jgi:hypothetical protein
MKTLPKQLQNAISTVSATIQQLIFDVALHASGLPAEPARSSAAIHRDRTQHEGKTAARNEQLRQYVEAQARAPHPRYPLSPYDYALVIMSLAGHTSRRIAEFLGLEHMPLKKRLDAVLARAKTAEKDDEDAELGVRSDVLEAFSEAQNLIRSSGKTSK